MSNLDQEARKAHYEWHKPQVRRYSVHLVECITLSVTCSFISDFSFLPLLAAVHLYRLSSAIFLFRLGVKESKLGRYAGGKGSSFFSPTAAIKTIQLQGAKCKQRKISN